MSKLEIQPKKYPPQCMGCSKNPHIILVDKLFPKFAIQDPGQSLKRLNLSQRNMRCYCVCAHVYICVTYLRGYKRGKDIASILEALLVLVF